MTESHSGTSGAPITITAYPGEQPVITGRFKISGSWTTVSHLHFLGSTPSNSNGVLLYVSGADHVSVLSNEFDHSNMSAMYLGDVGNGSDYATIEGNYIHDNGTDTNLDHGIYFGTGAHGTIENNVITQNFARGIQCYPDCDDTVIANNTVVGNGRAGIQIGNEAVSTSDRDTVVNNIVALNGNDGIRSYWGGTAGVGNVAGNNLLWTTPREHRRAWDRVLEQRRREPAVRVELAFPASGRKPGNRRCALAVRAVRRLQWARPWVEAGPRRVSALRNAAIRSSWASVVSDATCRSPRRMSSIRSSASSASQQHRIGRRARVARLISRPRSPWPSASATPPTAVATIGSPAASASKSTCGRPSVSDTCKNACAAR